MPFCSQCGNEYPDGGKFCPRCGAELSGADAEAVPVSEERCPNATVVDDGPTGKERNKRSRGKVVAVVAECVAVVVAAGAGLFLLLGGQQPASLAIDETAFPNEVIRQALLEQIDADGDGVLAAEEAATVTGLVLTRDAAIFFLDGAEVSVPEGGAVADDAEDNDVGDGEAEAEDGADADADDAPASSLAGLEALPNLRTLVARDAGLAELPAASLPSLEYIDCRNNPIASIDLSGNANLSTMFCDPAVELTGLEEAGLYFTELLTEVENINNEESLSFEYDSRGRPVKVVEYSYGNFISNSYLYDDLSRLVEVNTEYEYSPEYEVGVYDVMTESTLYVYGESGLLEEVCESTEAYADHWSYKNYANFEYDREGMARSIAYSHEDENGSREPSRADVFCRDAAGNVTSSSVNLEDDSTEDVTWYHLDSVGFPAEESYEDYLGSVTSGSASLEYSNFDQLMQRDSTRYYEDGDSWSELLVATYSDDGFPAEVLTSFGDNSFNWEIECDDGGYPLKVRCVDGDISFVPPEYACSYVKMIGRLEDRASRRYVPIFGWEINQDYTTDEFVPYGDGEWYDGYEGPTVTEFGPVRTALSAMGLLPRSLACPNEMQLLAYDREHWADGLNLAGLPEPNPIGGAEQRDDLTSGATAADDQIYDIQTRLFSLNLPDSWRDKVDIEVTDADGDYPSARVFLKGNPDIYLLGMNVVDASEEMLDGDAGAGVADRVPLPNDKRLDIGTCYYGTILLECDESGSEPYFGSLTDGQYADLFEMIYGSPMTVEELLSDNTIEKRSMIHELQRQHIQDAISSSIIVNGFA